MKSINLCKFMACHPDILAYYDKTHPLFLRNILSNNVWCICGCLRYSSSKAYWKEQHKTNSISQVHSSINVSHHINTKRFVSRSTWLQYLNWSIYFQGYIQCVTLLSVLLTMDSIILSFKAKVSPCFSLILFCPGISWHTYIMTEQTLLMTCFTSWSKYHYLESQD